MGGHAVRLIQRDGRESRPVRDGIAVNLVGRSPVEFEVARQRLDIGPRLPERLADVPCFELRQQIDVLQDALADPMQDATTVRRRQASPVAGQRGPGRPDRALDILAAAAGNVGKMRTVRRIQDRETTPIGGIDPAAGDVVAVSPFGFRQDALQSLILLHVVQDVPTKLVSTKFVFASIRNASRVPTRQAQRSWIAPRQMDADSRRRAFGVGRRSSDDLDRTESGMSCEAGAENGRIVVRPCVDAEVDGRPAFHINHHPEFDHPQSKALHIGQQLGCRGKRVRGNGPEDDG
jgi:hypothetical protein